MKRGPGRPFKPGQSGNPAGRPRQPVDMTELAKSRSVEMLEVLIAVARDATAPASARVSAATAVLDRGYGKPVMTVNATVKRSLVDFTDDELMSIIKAEQDKAEQDAADLAKDDGQVSGPH